MVPDGQRTLLGADAGRAVCNAAEMAGRIAALCAVHFVKASGAYAGFPRLIGHGALLDQAQRRP